MNEIEMILYKNLIITYNSILCDFNDAKSNIEYYAILYLNFNYYYYYIFLFIEIYFLYTKLWISLIEQFCTKNLNFIYSI